MTVLNFNSTSNTSYMLYITKILKALHTKQRDLFKNAFFFFLVLQPIANYYSFRLPEALSKTFVAVTSKFRAEHCVRYFAVSQNVVVICILHIKLNCQVFWYIGILLCQKTTSRSLLLCT